MYIRTMGNANENETAPSKSPASLKIGNITLSIKSNILTELSANPNNEDDRGDLKINDPKIKQATIYK